MLCSVALSVRHVLLSPLNKMIKLKAKIMSLIKNISSDLTRIIPSKTKGLTESINEILHRSASLSQNFSFHVRFPDGKHNLKESLRNHTSIDTTPSAFTRPLMNDLLGAA
jgi:hypothetical protein